MNVIRQYYPCIENRESYLIEGNFFGKMWEKQRYLILRVIGKLNN